MSAARDNFAVLLNPNALFACRDAASALNLTAQPSANNRRQHRFRNNNLVLDVMVPDHMPRHLLMRLAGRDPVPIEGGYRALQRAAQCAISTEAGEAIVPVPDLQGALVLKARAFGNTEVISASSPSMAAVVHGSGLA